LIIKELILDHIFQKIFMCSDPVRFGYQMLEHELYSTIEFAEVPPIGQWENPIKKGRTKTIQVDEGF
jgi:hypothetical protein